MSRAGEISLSFLILFVISAAAFADDRTHKFQQGNDFYQNGEYENAVASYEEILGSGYESAELYYNLGNAYYKLGKNSRAILNYERGLQLRPNDEDIRFNLQIANLSLIDKIPAIPELFYLRHYRKFRDLFGLHTLTFVTLVLYFILSATLITWILSRRLALRRTWRLISITLSLFFAVSTFLLVSKIIDYERSVEAIVMAEELDVLSSPSGNGTEIFTIHEGLKIKITDQRENWYEIRLSDGKEGWLPSESIEII
jgi:tetratricopeptide (TPR) repeat protein